MCYVPGDGRSACFGCVEAGEECLSLSVAETKAAANMNKQISKIYTGYTALFEVGFRFDLRSRCSDTVRMLKCRQPSMSLMFGSSAVDNCIAW